MEKYEYTIQFNTKKSSSYSHYMLLLVEKLEKLINMPLKSSESSSQLMSGRNPSEAPSEPQDRVRERMKRHK